MWSFCFQSTWCWVKSASLLIFILILYTKFTHILHPVKSETEATLLRFTRISHTSVHMLKAHCLSLHSSFLLCLLVSCNHHQDPVIYTASYFQQQITLVLFCQRSHCFNTISHYGYEKTKADASTRAVKKSLWKSILATLLQTCKFVGTLHLVCANLTHWALDCELLLVFYFTNIVWIIVQH